MDRRRRTRLLSPRLPEARRLGGLLTSALVAGIALAQTQTASLQAARWLPPERQRQALSREPEECLAPAADPATATRIAIGRAAFRTPLLLGGQAARNGLSCNACHRNGRGNPDFFITGVSATPGTADVTTSILSSHRGDGVFNPKPIPDLASAVSLRHAARSGDRTALLAFIRGLIVEEFDGPEPSAATLEGLGEYVDHLRPSACTGTAPQPIRLDAALRDAREAMLAAQSAHAANDVAVARLMVASARSALQTIDERYRAPELDRERLALTAASRELGAIREAIDKGEPDVSARIAVWLAGMSRWSALLKRNEARSLFDAEKLHLHLDAGPHGGRRRHPDRRIKNA